MIRPLVLALSLSLMALPAVAGPETRDPAKVPAGAYVLDGRHASLIVKIPHMGGFSRFTLRFDKLSGGFTYDPAAWAATKATITVDPKSVSTGLPDFDKTIAGPEYFDAARYPAITYAVTAIQAAAEGKGTVTGDLTFHGVTRPVTLDVVFNGAGSGFPVSGERMGFSGTGRIKRSEFGVTRMAAMAGDDLDLIFDVEFVKP